MDVLRGLALLGIFLMNIEGMAAPMMQSMTGIDPRWQGLDRMADALVYVFVQGKFYTLFSLLFGMGFALFLQRARAAGYGARLFARRLVVLLGIGLVHALLIWSGDILVSYAVAGFALLLFANTSPKALWRWGIGLFLLMPAMLLAMSAVTALAGDAMHSERESFEAMLMQLDADHRSAYGAGTYWQATAQRMADFQTDVLENVLWFVPTLLGIFLMGAAIQRMGVLADVPQHTRLLRRWLYLALPLGLGLMLASVWVSPVSLNVLVPEQALAQALLMLAQLPMALSYLAAVVLLMQHRQRVLGWLAPVGRMALTNYLLQSVIATLLFYGYGLGWYEQVSRVAQVGLVLLVFAGQVVLSHWWMRRFAYGPAEWLWRWGTYGRMPVMRVS